MEKILVTGGAGFIGSHLCEALLKRGDSIVCADDFNDYYSPKIKEQNIKECLKSKNFRLYREDIRDLKKLKIIFDDNEITGVVHLAARAGVRPSIANPLLYEETNVKGTLNLLELSKNVKNFIFGSSSSVYGNSKTPFSEEDRVDNPISPYAATKKAGELLCSTYHHLYNIPVTCLRFFTVYGPRGRPDMAPYKFTKLIDEGMEIEMYGDGSAKRDYTYITDVVSGILAALDKRSEFEIINLGNSKTVELNYFISLIEKLLSKKAKIRKMPMQPGDVNATWADISKAKKLLGWEPKVRIEEGMEKFVKWFGEEGEIKGNK